MDVELGRFVVFRNRLRHSRDNDVVIMLTKAGLTRANRLVT
jgi:hypothetical protein